MWVRGVGGQIVYSPKKPRITVRLPLQKLFVFLVILSCYFNEYAFIVNVYSSESFVVLCPPDGFMVKAATSINSRLASSCVKKLIN